MSNETEGACPYHKLRDDLPPLTDRIKRLPIDERGYPVPFFVQWLFKPLTDTFEGGKPAPRGHPQAYPEFRLADGNAMKACMDDGLCWVCGEKLGVWRAFVVGPMCVINHTSAEPPSHVDCAEWSVKGCPFLSKPNMKRREDHLTQSNEGNVAGEMIRRNPGVMVIWIIKGNYRTFPDGKGKVLIDIGQSLGTTYWKEGRPATKDEVFLAVKTGLPALYQMAETKEDMIEIQGRALALFDSIGIKASLSSR